MSAQGEWYYIWAGRAHGPVTWQAFEALLVEGIRPDRVTLAREGDEAWMTPDEARQADRMGPLAGTFGLPATTGLAAQSRPENVRRVLLHPHRQHSPLFLAPDHQRGACLGRGA